MRDLEEQPSVGRQQAFDDLVDFREEPELVAHWREATPGGYLCIRRFGACGSLRYITAATPLASIAQ